MKLNKSEITALAREIKRKGDKMVEDLENHEREKLRGKAKEQADIFAKLDPVIQARLSDEPIEEFIGILFKQQENSGFFPEVKTVAELEDEIALKLREAKTLEDIRAWIKPFAGD